MLKSGAKDGQVPDESLYPSADVARRHGPQGSAQTNEAIGEKEVHRRQKAAGTGMLECMLEEGSNVLLFLRAVTTEVNTCWDLADCPLSSLLDL